jgi:hypothetical protein
MIMFGGLNLIGELIQLPVVDSFPAAAGVRLN